MRVVLAAVIVGGLFGTATATVETIDEDVMVIDLEVEFMGTADSVVAHLAFEDEELALPLLDRGDGVYGIRTELEPKNYVVVFEAVGGEASAPITLAQMGADLLPDSGATMPTEVEDDALSDESRQSLWLAIALAAASLSLIAFWVLGGREEESEESGVADQEE
ncbi:MAG: hypothetical protein PVF87_13775 [Acidimicrobiia bacterium]